jgi:ribulose 1,5-bisphosphate synthetase/thiazole synthase
MGEVLELPDYVAGNGVSVSDVIVIGSGPGGLLQSDRRVAKQCETPLLININHLKRMRRQ